MGNFRKKSGDSREETGIKVAPPARRGRRSMRAYSPSGDGPR